MARISYSQLSMFNECPKRWKLNYVDKLRVSESNIYLVFGTAMHEVIQTYLDIMYNNSVKNAEKLDLNKMLFDNMCSEFTKAKEQYGKEPCTKEELKEFLESVSLAEGSRKEQEIAESQQQVLNKAPLKIYIGYINVTNKTIFCTTKRI